MLRSCVLIACLGPFAQSAVAQNSEQRQPAEADAALSGVASPAFSVQTGSSSPFTGAFQSDAIPSQSDTTQAAGAPLLGGNFGSARPFQISVYGGVQGVSDGRPVTGEDPAGLGPFDFLADFAGDSFEDTPYFGVRGTWWPTEKFGLSLDFTHSKATATDETLAVSGFEALEFANGINTLTLNGLRRFPNNSSFTPYLGGGLGISIPNVEVQSSPTAPGTSEYQLGGFVAQFSAGVNYEINERWSVFGEYQFNYVDLGVDLDAGGSLSTDFTTNAFNIGAGFSF